MTHITLSIPEKLYRLMKRYREVNWSEVARRAIVEKLFSLKAGRDGLTREELAILLEIIGEKAAAKGYNYRREVKFLEMIEDREKKRIKFLERLEES